MPRTVPTGRGRPSKAIRTAHRPARRAGPHSWPAVAALLTAFVLGVAVAFAVGALASGPDATDQKIAEMQRADAERDVRQIAELTELARGSRDRLAPVLQGMAAAAPIGKNATVGPRPTAEVVRGWRDAASAEVARHADAPSAGTAVNVARGGLRTAVQQLAGAIDVFDVAVAANDQLTGGKLILLAGQQRTLGVRTWSVAAIQLDVINIDAGNGHVHVQLPAGPESGAIAPDGSPEGSGRR